MRYLGSLENLEPVFFKSGGALDPAVKAQLMPYAQTMPDEKARDLLELADATPLGRRTKLLRIGLGAGLGLVVGFALGKSAKKKR